MFCFLNQNQNCICEHRAHIWRTVKKLFYQFYDVQISFPVSIAMSFLTTRGQHNTRTLTHQPLAKDHEKCTSSERKWYYSTCLMGYFIHQNVQPLPNEQVHTTLQITFLLIEIKKSSNLSQFCENSFKMTQQKVRSFISL